MVSAVIETSARGITSKWLSGRQRQSHRRTRGV